MAYNVSNLPPLGKTFFDGETPSTAKETIALEGKHAYLVPRIATTGTGVAATNQGGGWDCLLVRNDSSGTLAAKDVVSWKANYRGKRVDGKTGTAKEKIAGVVDPLLTTTVADNDLFWLVRKGFRVPVAKATGAAWTEGNPLTTNNAGKLTTTSTPTGIDVRNIAGAAHDDVTDTTATTGYVDLEIV